MDVTPHADARLALAPFFCPIFSGLPVAFLEHESYRPKRMPSEVVGDVKSALVRDSVSRARESKACNIASRRVTGVSELSRGRFGG